MRSFRYFLSSTILFFISFAALYGGGQLFLGPLSTEMVLLFALIAAVIASALVGQLAPAVKENVNDPHLKAAEASAAVAAPIPEAQARLMADLEQRVRELKMLRQFSEALNFTIDFDAMLWLVYTHSQDILNSRDFYIYLSDLETGQLYTAFCYEDGERRTEKEGPHLKVTEKRVRQIIEIGLVHENQDEEGRYWLTAPLNAGAETVGAVRASHAQLNQPFAPHKFDLFARLAFNAAAAFDHWMTNQSLQTRAQQLESLIGVIHSINAVQGVEPLLELILDKSVQLIGVQSGSCLLVDPETGELVFRVVQGPYSEKIAGTRLPFGKGIAGRVAQTGEPLIINDVEDSSLWFSGIDDKSEFRTESILTVPLIHQRDVLGVLQLVNRRNGLPFTSADLTLLTAFAGEAAVTLENARLLQQTDAALQERVEELSLLREIDRQLTHQLEMEGTVQNMLLWMQRLYQASAGYIVLLDSAGGAVVHKMAGSDQAAADIEQWEKGDLPEPVGQVIRSGDPLVSGGAALPESFFTAGEGTRSQMTIPIKQERQVIGVISIESDRPQAYGQAELASAVDLVNHMTAALINSLLYLRVQDANRAKSEFVSVVSHELKTPLTSIRGYTGLMKSGLTGALTEKQQEFLATIEGNVARMTTLIQDLTDVARLDTGHLRISFESILIDEVVNETISSIRSLLDQKQIKLHLELLPESPRVMGDRTRLVQVRDQSRLQRLQIFPGRQ